MKVCVEGCNISWAPQWPAMPRHATPMPHAMPRRALPCCTTALHEQARPLQAVGVALSIGTPAMPTQATSCTETNQSHSARQGSGASLGAPVWRILRARAPADAIDDLHIPPRVLSLHTGARPAKVKSMQVMAARSEMETAAVSSMHAHRQHVAAACTQQRPFPSGKACIWSSCTFILRHCAAKSNRNV